MGTLPTVEAMHSLIDDQLASAGLLGRVVEELVIAREHRAQGIQNEHLAGFLTRKTRQEIATLLLGLARVRDLAHELALVVPSERHAELAVKVGMLVNHLVDVGRSVSDDAGAGAA